MSLQRIYTLGRHPMTVTALLRKVYVRFLKRRTRGDWVAYSLGIDVRMVERYLEEDRSREEASRSPT